MKLHHLAFGAILGLVVFCIPSCQEGAEATGRVIVQITDEPFPIDLISEANVTITKVEIRAAGEEVEEESTTEDTDGTTSPYITLFEGSYEVNLLGLRNGITDELADMEIPAGDYDLIRVYVENASIAVTGYETYTVKVPSGSETGIKLFISPGLKVAGGLTAEILLDFNVEKSFVLQGDLETAAGIKGFNFKPVIRAVNNTVSGTITGIVTEAGTEAPLSGVTISVEVKGEVLTAITSAEGFYAIPGIPAGFYTVTAEQEGYISLTTNEIEVLAGNATTQNFAMGVDLTL